MVWFPSGYISKSSAMYSGFAPISHYKCYWHLCRGLQIVLKSQFTYTSSVIAPNTFNSSVASINSTPLWLLPENHIPDHQSSEDTGTCKYNFLLIYACFSTNLLHFNPVCPVQILCSLEKLFLKYVCNPYPPYHTAMCMNLNTYLLSK